MVAPAAVEVPDVVRRGRRSRAEPMAPADRRAAIITATLPLLRAHGRTITTRQIARAAGIAEGTIFGVFRDKDELVDAAVAAALDPAEAIAAIDQIDLGLSIDERITAAAAIIQHRLSGIFELMNALGVNPPPKRPRRDRPDLAHLAALFEPDRSALTVEPRTAAQLLWGLTLAANHPASPFDATVAPAEIVAVLLHGISAHPAS